MPLHGPEPANGGVKQWASLGPNGLKKPQAEPCCTLSSRVLFRDRVLESLEAGLYLSAANLGCYRECACNIFLGTSQLSLQSNIYNSKAENRQCCAWRTVRVLNPTASKNLVICCLPDCLGYVQKPYWCITVDKSMILLFYIVLPRLPKASVQAVTWRK